MIRFLSSSLSAIGCGHILKDGKIPTYKIPYSFVHKKLETQTIYNHHKLEEKDGNL